MVRNVFSSKNSIQNWIVYDLFSLEGYSTYEVMYEGGGENQSHNIYSYYLMGSDSVTK